MGARRPIGAVLDPPRERHDRLFGQASRGRHPERLVLVPYRAEQETLFRPTRQDRGACVTSLEQRITAVDPQSAARLLPSVAGEARPCEDRTDLEFEPLISRAR